MTQEETTLVWLTKKVSRDRETIEKAEEFYRERRWQWSKGVERLFYKMIEAMKDQLYFEESRLEKLAWKIHMDRDANTDSRGRRLI